MGGDGGGSGWWFSTVVAVVLGGGDGSQRRRFSMAMVLDGDGIERWLPVERRLSGDLRRWFWVSDDGLPAKQVTSNFVTQ
jgi:hypothetical protein